MDEFIPFSKASIGEDEIKAVTDVLKSGWLTVGPKVREFENMIKEQTKSLHAVTFDSCTSALTVSLRIFKESVYGPVTATIPALTFVATANAAYHAGYKIKFCDVDWDGNIDEFALSNSNDLTIPVHFAGQVCNLEEISKKSHLVVEDAAHAFGATYEDLYLGNHDFSMGACYSFYPTKIITTIEGGLFITKHELLSDLCRTRSLHGLGSAHVDRYSERSSLNKLVVDDFPGYKANMTDVEAAIGIVQLGKFKYFNIIRKRIAKRYTEELADKVSLLKVNGRDHVWHMFVILVPDRERVVSGLKAKGIGTGIHYSPIIPAHPFYQKLTNYNVGDFPVAEYISDHCISLPLYPSMTDQQIEKVIKSVKELV